LSDDFRRIIIRLRKEHQRATSFSTTNKVFRYNRELFIIIKSYFQFVMSQNDHVMTNTETGSTVYFIDFVVSNTNYSIDILTYPVPASLPTGFTSDISFIGVDKNPRLTKDELLYMYLQATKQKFDVFIINLDKSDNERYRHNFLDYYQTDSKDLKI